MNIAGLAKPTISLMTALTLLLAVLLVSAGNSPLFPVSTASAHDAPNNICDRVEAVQNAIKTALNRPGASCEDVSVHSSSYQSIARLTVSGGQLETLPSGSFYNLIGLETLHINSLGLDQLPEDIFDDLSQLRILSLSWNDLDELPEDIFDGLSNLTHLYLEGNELTALHQDVFDGLSSLEWLVLTDNDLSTLHAEVFDDLTTVTHLYLGSNDLSTLPADVFDDLDSLEILVLTNNELTTLPVNAFDDIDDTLEGLFVGYNDLALDALPDDFFETFPNLAGLSLRGIGKDYQGDDEGSLTHLNYDWWDDLAGLNGLNLNNNELATLPSDAFDGFSSLTGLDLGNNDLTELPADVFEDQTNLQRLELYNNQLTAVPADLLDGFTQLESLYLFENQLTTLPNGLFEGLTNLQSLKLHGNPGAPFTFRAELEESSDNGVAVKVVQAAPYSMAVSLSVTGGTLSATAATIAAGNIRSEAITFTHSGDNPVTISVDSVQFVGRNPRGVGVSTGAGDALTIGNNPASGAPTISGTAQAGETLTADTSGISDADGLDDVAYSYQWLADDTDIDGATSSTYELQASDEGKVIKVRVTFTDDAGNEESLTSEATAAVAAAPTPLTASIHNAPERHDGENSFTFELRFSETPRDGFSFKTLRDHAFTVTGGDVVKARRLEPGKNIRWEITVTPSSSADVTITLPATTDCDNQGAICTGDGRKLSGRVEVSVSAPNNVATGAPTISGTVQVDETLTAGTSGIADEDGLTNVSYSYQWLADGEELSGSTGSTYTLVSDDEGKAISVAVSFTDDAGNDESLTSDATDAVEAKPNTPATGAPAISGTAQVGETLTANTSAIADEDGLDDAEFSYQWLADGADISGATDATYTLAGDDEGKAISVTVSFTDDAGNDESLTSDATEEVAAKANTPATGAPTISGTIQVGETLTAGTSGIADEDGLDNAAYSYQWLADDTDISGATDSTYTLVESDKGKAIKVKVSFTDDAGNDETLTSDATDAVAGLPPEPLTASIENAATSHDGTAFTFELRFSEELGLSYKTLRDHAFTVTGGDVKKAKRLEQGSNIGWRITVKPNGNGDVTIVLPETSDCDAQGAICTEDGRKLSNRLELTVSGTGS